MLIASAGVPWPGARALLATQGVSTSKACLLRCSLESNLVWCRVVCGGRYSGLGPRLQAGRLAVGRTTSVGSFAVGRRHVLHLRERGLRSPWLWV